MNFKSIGFIGTGLMGNPMAKHLLKAGYTVNVHNRTKSKTGSLLELGARWFDTPAALAEQSEVVITMIGFPKDVEACYFGAAGVFQGIKRGAVAIDMTTTKPSLAIRIAQHAGTLGVDFVDAPVSGGEVGAINGTLSIMIGGDPDVVERVKPLFDAFGKNSVYQGLAGAGQHAKMCNQITIAGTLIGVCEGLLYGFKAGLDLNTLLQSISKGAAGCWSLDVLAPKLIKGDFSPGFTVDNFVKDLGIALEEAETMRLSLPGLALVKQLYVSIQAMGKGSLGNQSLYLALEKLANVNQDFVDGAMAR